jgi:hypothetical protein
MPVVDFYVEYQRKNNRNVGKLLLEGELVDEKEERIVTCSLQTFDQYMRAQYQDWPEFEAWREDRYWLHMGYEGGVPAKWWEIA